MILALTAAAKEYMVEQLVLAEKNYVLLEVKGGGCSGLNMIGRMWKMIAREQL